MTKPAKDLKEKEVNIHPTAIVHPGAELDTGVSVGPYSVVGEEVRIGKGTKLYPHVVIGDWTTIGQKTTIFQFASVGAAPQDLAYKGEKTETIIGDNNVIREFVTIHRGTAKDKKRTVCGNNNLFMNYVHIAHDCIVGNHVIVANGATLAGHVTIEDHAILGGLVPVHQYVRIGSYCIVGGASAVSKDVPPYVMAVGNRAHLFGLNMVGLRRKGFSKQDIEEIKKAYNILFRSHLKLSEAVERLKKELPGSPHADRFIKFIENSKRGLIRERVKKRGETPSMD
jgi:UDP-N-acetylglucosamine acyltransferase